MLKYIIPVFLIVTALKAQENNNLKWLNYEPNFRYLTDGSILREQVDPDMIGLKNDSLNNFRIVVENIKENSLGITKKNIEDIAFMALFANGIKPEKDNDNYLYININVVGMAFNISISFERTVSYIVNRKKYKNYGSRTWHKGFTGTHGQNKMFITDSLRELLDKFSIEYINANK